jgi:hypothetical protein
VSRIHVVMEEPAVHLVSITTRAVADLVSLEEIVKMVSVLDKLQVLGFIILTEEVISSISE